MVRQKATQQKSSAVWLGAARGDSRARCSHGPLPTSARPGVKAGAVYRLRQAEGSQGRGRDCSRPRAARAGASLVANTSTRPAGAKRLVGAALSVRAPTACRSPGPALDQAADRRPRAARAGDRLCLPACWPARPWPARRRCLSVAACGPRRARRHAFVDSEPRVHRRPATGRSRRARGQLAWHAPLQDRHQRAGAVDRVAHLLQVAFAPRRCGWVAPPEERPARDGDRRC